METPSNRKGSAPKMIVMNTPRLSHRGDLIDAHEGENTA